VGDSVAMVMHGHPSTVTANMDMMRIQAVARGAAGKFIVADMPFFSFRKGWRRLSMRLNMHAQRFGAPIAS